MVLLRIPARTTGGGGAGTATVIGGASQTSTGANGSFFYHPSGGDTAVGTETDISVEFNFAWNFTRMTLRIRSNTKSLDVPFTMRDDVANIVGSLITVDAGLTGIFDTGAQSTAVATASIIALESIPAGTGAIAYTFHWEGEPT